jgi:hypothetical protein
MAWQYYSSIPVWRKRVNYFLPAFATRKLGRGGGGVSTPWCYPFLENEGGWLVVGPQLEDMAQVQGRLLEMPVGLQDLAQLNRLSKI